MVCNKRILNWYPTRTTRGIFFFVLSSSRVISMNSSSPALQAKHSGINILYFSYSKYLPKKKKNWHREISDLWYRVFLSFSAIRHGWSLISGWHWFHLSTWDIRMADFLRAPWSESTRSRLACVIDGWSEWWSIWLFDLIRHLRRSLQISNYRSSSTKNMRPWGIIAFSFIFLFIFPPFKPMLKAPTIWKE